MPRPDSCQNRGKKYQKRRKQIKKSLFLSCFRPILQSLLCQWSLQCALQGASLCKVYLKKSSIFGCKHMQAPMYFAAFLRLANKGHDIYGVFWVFQAAAAGRPKELDLHSRASRASFLRVFGQHISAFNDTCNMFRTDFEGMCLTSCDIIREDVWFFPLTFSLEASVQEFASQTDHQGFSGQILLAKLLLQRFWILCYLHCIQKCRSCRKFCTAYLQQLFFAFPPTQVSHQNMPRSCSSSEAILCM